MPLPLRYRDKTERQTVNFDYVDFAEGTGIVQFYGSGLADDSGVTYRLDKNPFSPDHTKLRSAQYKSNREIRSSSSATEPTTLFDLDFDTSPFNVPRTLRGTMIVQIPYGTVPGAGAQPRIQVTVTVRSVTSGDVETDIVSVTSSEHYVNSSGIGIVDGMITFPITVPKTTIKATERLRINLDVICDNKNDDASGSGYIICFDPDGNAVVETGGSTVTDTLTMSAGRTTMKFFVPFQIEG